MFDEGRVTYCICFTDKRELSLREIAYVICKAKVDAPFSPRVMAVKREKNPADMTTIMAGSRSSFSARDRFCLGGFMANAWRLKLYRLTNIELGAQDYKFQRRMYMYIFFRGRLGDSDCRKATVTS